MKLNLVEKAKQSHEKKILEVGAGTGDFLAACRRREWSCFGVEPSAQARETARQFNNLNLLSSIEEIGEGRFSVITLWHVLEHISDLGETILKLRNMLSENGVLIIAVPNHNSFDAKHYKRTWAGYDVPRHLFHFNKQSLTSIIESKGFKLMKIKPMVFDSFYVSILSERYMRSYFIISNLKAILIGLISNVSALFTGESSSLILVFNKIEKS
ncbi:MAG TPA: class I SAM-dependent methyltransferase [Bacteroidia bacterium]|nr:class I SAM-dependent methyltransferase [Bacteroidia bacterium]